MTLFSKIKSITLFPIQKITVNIKPQSLLTAIAIIGLSILFHLYLFNASISSFTIDKQGILNNWNPYIYITLFLVATIMNYLFKAKGFTKQYLIYDNANLLQNKWLNNTTALKKSLFIRNEILNNNYAELLIGSCLLHALFFVSLMKSETIDFLLIKIFTFALVSMIFVIECVQLLYFSLCQNGKQVILWQYDDYVLLQATMERLSKYENHSTVKSILNKINTAINEMEDLISNPSRKSFYIYKIYNYSLFKFILFSPYCQYFNNQFDQIVKTHINKDEINDLITMVSTWEDQHLPESEFHLLLKDWVVNDALSNNSTYILNNKIDNNDINSNVMVKLFTHNTH